MIVVVTSVGLVFGLKFRSGCDYGGVMVSVSFGLAVGLGFGALG